MNNPELCEHGRHWRMCPHCLGISRGVNQPAASVTASMRCNGETHYTGCPCHEANWREQMRLLAATKDALIADLESRLAAALEANAKQAEFERDGLRAKLAESERLLTVYRTASIRDGETMRELYTALGKVTNWGVESQALAAKVDGAAEIDRMRQLLSQLAELGESLASSFDPNGLTTARESIRYAERHAIGYEILQTIDPERRFDGRDLTRKDGATELAALRVAAAANLEKLRALKRDDHHHFCAHQHDKREPCNCATLQFNAAIDTAIRVLGGE